MLGPWLTGGVARWKGICHGSSPVVGEAKKRADAAWRLRGRDGWWLRREKPRPDIVRAGAAACMAVHAELFQGYGFRQIPKMRGKPESWVMGARGVWILHAQVLRLRLGAHSSDDDQSVQCHERAPQISSITCRKGPTTTLNVTKPKERYG